MKHLIIWIYSAVSFLAITPVFAQSCPETYRQGNGNFDKKYDDMFETISKGKVPNQYYGTIPGEVEFKYPYKFLDWTRWSNKIDSLHGKSWREWTTTDWKIIDSEMREMKDYVQNNEFINKLPPSAKSEVYSNLENQIQGIKCYISQAPKSKSRDDKPSVEQEDNHDERDTKSLDERQEASFVAWIEQGESEESNELDSGKTPRKKVYPPMQGKCLRVVDIKGSRSDKRFYWYAIQNVCKQPVHAHWCAGEKSECKQSKQAWLIQPGEKERSWMLTSRGPQGVQLYGTACLDKFQGQQVFYDKKSSKCWAWSGN